MARHRATFDGDRLTAQVTFQLAPAEKELLKEAANGATLSEYVRELCLRRARSPVVAGARKDPAARLLAGELHALGNNLNQLAKVANQVGDLQRESELDRTVDLIKVALQRVISL